MSNHAPKVDFGSKILFIVSAVALLGAVYVLVASLVNTYNRNSTKGELDSTHLVSLAEDNLKPIGTSATSDAAPAAPVAARSGEEVYGAVCGVCHKAGVAGAPKLDDKAAWEPRVATGLDALMTTAINGKGAMPARGGNPSVTDAELKATILYMTKEAGFDLGGGEAAAPKEAAPAKAEEKPAVAEPAKTEEKPVVAEPVKKEEKQEVIAPVLPTTPATPEEPAAPEEPALVAAATTEEKAPAAAATTGGDGAAVYAAKGCAACHGADAKTPIMPLYPKIAGQSVTYVTQQLADIKSGKRSNGQSVVMKGIMAGVSDDEIAVLAKYISTL